MKIVVGTAFWGVLCCAPLFVFGDEGTNTPAATIPAPASDPGTNQLAQVTPTDGSVDSLRKKAEAGDKESQFHLGISYQYGLGVQKDPIEAVGWYRKAADQGDSNAQFYLGVAYASGSGVDEDETEAAKWYRKAADQGCAVAQYNLARSYLLGTGVNKDISEGLKWERKAADNGYAIAQYITGLSYLEGTGNKKDFAEAAKWFHKSADQGIADAELRLGVCYEKGDGVEQDLEEAVKWYRKSAEQGDALAERNLASCYLLGKGVEKNVGEGSKWALKAAEQGDPLAQGIVGLMYVQGTGEIKNEVEGMAWLYVSNANGNELAAEAISSRENIYSAQIIEAARQRAAELQNQIASNPVPVEGDSGAAMVQQAPTSGTPKESGSGAIISADGLVLTAAHVVQGATRIEVVTATGPLTATVMKIDAPNDIAVLKCTGANFTPLPIAPSKEAREGATVFTVGFPNIQIQGFDPKLTKGEISSETGFQDDPRQWQISVPIQPGNSGGPLCDENGNLIGIVESTLNPLTMAKVEGEIPQNVNYAVKSSYILPLLDDVQNLPPALVPANGAKFEDTVSNVQKSVVLILVY